MHWLCMVISRSHLALLRHYLPSWLDTTESTLLTVRAFLLSPDHFPHHAH